MDININEYMNPFVVHICQEFMSDIFKTMGWDPAPFFLFFFSE